MYNERHELAAHIIKTATKISHNRDLIVFYDSHHFPDVQVVEWVMQSHSQYWHRNPDGSTFCKGRYRKRLWEVLFYDIRHPYCIQVSDRQIQRLGLMVYGTFTQ